jgi:hypothetical protein
VIRRVLPDQPKLKQIAKPLTRNKHLSLLYFWAVLIALQFKDSSQPFQFFHFSWLKTIHFGLKTSNLSPPIFFTYILTDRWSTYYTVHKSAIVCEETTSTGS